MQNSLFTEFHSSDARPRTRISKTLWFGSRAPFSAVVRREFFSKIGDVRHRIADRNQRGLFFFTAFELDRALREALGAEHDAKRDAEQIRRIEAHAWAFAVAIIEEHFDTTREAPRRASRPHA